MMRSFVASLSVVGLVSAAFADNHFQDLARDALGDAQTFSDYSRDAADDVLAIPVETDPPQSDMTPSDLEEGGLISAAGNTVQGRTYGTISNNIGDWSVSEVDQSNLANADAVVADPNAIIDEDLFSTSGGICSVDEFSDGPVFERVCSSTRSQEPATCTSTADITVVRTQRYGCSDSLVFGEECADLQDAPICTQTGSDGCGGIFGGAFCVREFTCSSDEDFAFSADTVGAPEWLEPVITWSETCEPTYSPDRCYDPQPTVCTSGPTVEDVNGLLVPMDCIEEETVWSCAANTYSSDCDVFEADASCSLISSECYLQNPDGECGAYENTFRCGSESPGGIDASCEAVNVCVGDVCQSIPNEQNDDIPTALVGIELLNTMAEDSYHNFDADDLLNDPDSIAANLQYFASRRRQCRIGILATLNCCRDSGWALGTIAQCNADEIELYASQEAGAAVYLSTYCSNEVLFICAQRSRRYCIFNSRLAKIVSVQGQEQLYGEFDCRSMTQEELEQIDFGQIDFSEAFGDLYSTVGDIGSTDLSSIVQDNILLAHPEVRDVYE